MLISASSGVFQRGAILGAGVVGRLTKFRCASTTYWSISPVSHHEPCYPLITIRKKLASRKPNRPSECVNWPFGGPTREFRYGSGRELGATLGATFSAESAGRCCAVETWAPHTVGGLRAPSMASAFEGRAGYKCSSRSRPPMAADTLAMNAPIKSASAV